MADTCIKKRISAFTALKPFRQVTVSLSTARVREPDPEKKKKHQRPLMSIWINKQNIIISNDFEWHGI